MATLNVRHLAGMRVLQVDEFNADLISEVTVGRDPAAHVRFDADGDDLVSRNHCKIRRDPLNPALFQLVDLQSRNGTFLNRQRVAGSSRLNHNDLIQLGPGGPEFRFELDPPPPGAPPLKEYTWAEPPAAMRPTAEVWPQQAAPEFATPRPVGRATVERMLGDAFSKVQSSSNRVAWIGAAALAAAGVAGIIFWSGVQKARQEQSQATQQSLNRLDQLKETIQNTPNAAEDVARLEAELKRSNAQNAATLKSLAAAVKVQNSQLSEALRREKLRQSAPPDTGNSARPIVPPTAFETLLTRTNAEIKEGRGNEALDLANQMVQMDPERWEGYAFAGISARMTGNLDLAGSLLSKAIMMMPADRRAPFEAYLNEIKKDSGK